VVTHREAVLQAADRVVRLAPPPRPAEPVAVVAPKAPVRVEGTP
jgi:hypothetical protein